MTSEVTDLVRGGSLSPYSHLFSQYRRRALRVASTLVNQPADADELVADAFERVLDTMRRGLGPDDQGFWSYLVVTMRHRAYDLHRRRRLERLTDDAELAEIARSAPLGSVATESARHLSETTLIRAFRRLPESYRLVLLLTEVEGQPNVVVGPILGISAGAVGSLAYRARLRLRELYSLEKWTTTPQPDRSQA